MNAAQQLAQALEQHGVQYIFGLPGDENLTFLEAVRASKVEFILTRHEQAAGFMAAAYGRLTGTPGVAMTTLGAGSTNLTTAMAHGLLSGAPMIAITGQKAVRDNHQGQYQLLDVGGVMAPISKWSHRIEGGSSVPAVIQEAFRVATAPKRRPVHLELPVDVALDAAEHELLPVREPDIVIAPDAAIAAAAGVVRGATKPLIVVGSYANRADASEALRALSDGLGIPFTPTMLGKGVLDEGSDLYLGTTTMAGADFVGRAVKSADLVITVGHDVMESPPFVMTPGDGRTVLHINDTPARADTIYFPQQQLVGDIATNLRCLTVALEGTPLFDANAFSDAAAAQRASVARDAADTSFPLKPQYAASQIRQHLGRDDIVVLDNGFHKMWMTRHYPTHAPLTNLGDGTLGSMGMALPYAMVASKLHPDRKVVAVIGDGGMMMSSQELETAVRMGLNLTVVVFNDNTLAMIKAKQLRDGIEPYGVDFKNPDFAMLAQSFGATGHRPQRATDFPAQLEDATTRGGVHLIDLAVDFKENMALMKELMMAGMPA